MIHSLETTFEGVARDWLKKKKADWTEGHYAKTRRRLMKHVFPWIGDLPIREIRVADIRPFLDRLVSQGNVQTAHRMRGTISRVFKFAMVADEADRDPAAALVEVLPERQETRHPTITDPTKVGQLLLDIDAYDGTEVVRSLLKLAPMVFARLGELRTALWSEIHWDHPSGPQYVVPPVRRKLRKKAKLNPITEPHVIPLSRQAIAILEQLKPLTGRYEHVFPGLRDTRKCMSQCAPNKALQRMGYSRTMVAHGFRHMASTVLNELGFDEDAIEAQLSHKKGGVRGVYNLAKHLPVRRKMMQDWSDYLDTLREAAKQKREQKQLKNAENNCGKLLH